MDTTSGIALQLMWILLALIALTFGAIAFGVVLVLGVLALAVALAVLLLPVAVVALIIILIVRGVKKSKQKKAALDKSFEL